MQSVTYQLQECIPVGCVPPAAVAVPGGIHQALPREQTPPLGPDPLGTDTPQSRPPPVNRMTDACEKYNLAPTSLRVVKTHFNTRYGNSQQLDALILAFSTEVHYYRPQTKLREGNVFTGVCDSVQGGWG